MLYYTPVDLPKSPKTISHQDSILLMGSCFTNHIADRLKFHLFNVLSNPFGVLYNPASIEQSIAIIKEKRTITPNDFFVEEDIYKSFLFHSHFSNVHLEPMLEEINHSMLRTHDFLSNSKWVFITFGTAYVYEHKESGNIVANCHKQPSHMFHHRMLSVEEASEKIKKIYRYIIDLSPEATVVFTVSPVRHLKQGASLNQVSKSTLLLAIYHSLSECHQAHYFPSYEIFMDELRDYRFFSNDMLHPSDLGIEHVWNKFSTVYFDKQTLELNKQIKEIQTALEHRPLFPQSKSYILFKNKIEDKIKQLKDKAPYLLFENKIWDK